MAQAKTPKVELRINVLQDENPREPAVLRATKRHLVCDYGGLVFKQPRENATVENQPSNIQKTKEHLNVTTGRDDEIGRVDAATPHHTLFLSQQNTVDKDHVGKLFAGWLEEETQRTGDIQVAKALLTMCRRVCTEDTLSADSMFCLDGELPFAPPAAVAAAQEVEQADYQVDLEARKAGLRARLKAYEKEIADWGSLLSEAEQYSGELRNVIPEVSSPESDATEPEDISELKQMHEDLHRHLTMQAEGLCKLVVDVEGLVDRANRTAHKLQTDYHQEKFRAFPHVDSPARLIKALVKPMPNS